jgi:DNA polymerase-4
MDTFFVSVERLCNKDLLGKPVLIGGTSDRGVVASCSYEARRFGVHSAMPMRLARQLCPDAIIVKGDMDRYGDFSKQVTEIITENAPVVEKASIDEHYLDLTGMDKYLGCMKWATELRQKIIKNTGLPISFGLSSSKTVSKIATGEAKPSNQLQVGNGVEKLFLAPLSIRKIPMLGNKTAGLLRNMGVDRISTIQQMPLELMAQVLGENGISIWQKANGICNSPVVPYSERKSLSTESTFDKDSTDMEFLIKTLRKMVHELSFDLRNEHRLTSCITVKIRYSNFDTHTQQARIAYTASDTILTEKAIEMFHKLYSQRMLIRLLGVKFSSLVQGTHQIDLFNDTVTHINLCEALDKIRARFGANAVLKAACL